MLNDTTRVLVVHWLADDAPPPTGTTSGVVLIVLALIGLAGTIASITIPLLLSGRARARHRRQSPHPLNSDSIDDGGTVDEQLYMANRRVRVYEIFLWRRRYDPNRILTGEEHDADVQF